MTYQGKAYAKDVPMVIIVQLVKFHANFAQTKNLQFPALSAVYVKKEHTLDILLELHIYGVINARPGRIMI